MLKDKRQVIAIYFLEIKAKKQEILPFFTRMRLGVAGFCEKTFSQPYAGLLAGMLLGFKNTLPDEITRSFRITDVSHIVAASRMNVTLVAGFLLSFLARLLKRQWAVFLSMVGIVGYMMLSGLDPSILRAGIMGICLFLVHSFLADNILLCIVFFSQ